MLARMRLILTTLLSLVALAACAPRSAAPIAPTEPVVSWIRPTPRPALDTTTGLTNISNMPGDDSTFALAVAPAPQPAWAAIAWVNVPPDEAENASVFVAVQDYKTRAWKRGIGINTTPAYGFASHPDVAIDRDGRLHAVFGQDGLLPHYSRSDDYGVTWTDPESLTVPAGFEPKAVYSRIAVDPAGHVHVFFAAGTGEVDRYRYIYHTRRSDATPGTPWQVETTVFPGDKQTRVALAFVLLPGGTVRTIAVTGCNAGCGAAQPAIAWRDGVSGPWRNATVPDATAVMPTQNINWVSAVSFRRSDARRGVCVAWGNYARSGNFASCSTNDGASWGTAETIIFTPFREDYQTEDTGSTPELLFEPMSDSLVAVSLYRQAGVPDTVYPVYSYRRAEATTWTPQLSGLFADHQPVNRLFPATRRSLAVANKGLRLAYQGHGLAITAWAELEEDENLDVYIGWWNPNGFLTIEGLPTVVAPVPQLPTRPPVAAGGGRLTLATSTPWERPIVVPNPTPVGGDPISPTPPSFPIPPGPVPTFVAPPDGTVWYVSKTGSNGDGRSWAAAWTDLDQIRWSSVQPGDVILLDGGTTEMIYRAPLEPATDGTRERPITIQLATEAGRNGRAVLFGGRATPLPYCDQPGYRLDAAHRYGIKLHGRSWLRIDGTKWRGITIHGFNKAGVLLSSGSHDLIVRNVEIYDNGHLTRTGDPDQEGVELSGTNITFERALIHDNGQDAFQSGGGVRNFTLRESWLYMSRKKPGGAWWNYCRHPDGIQIYGGGHQSGVLIEDSIIGPGFMQGLILGETDNGHSAIIHNVVMRHVLFVGAGNGSMITKHTPASGWVLDHVTSVREPGGKWHNIQLWPTGRGHHIRDSIFVGGREIAVPNDTVASNNCIFEIEQSDIPGQRTNPSFANPAAMDYGLSSSSPCSGRGSRMTSPTVLFNR